MHPDSLKLGKQLAVNALTGKEVIEEKPVEIEKAKLIGDWLTYKHIRIRYSRIDAIFSDSDVIIINGVKQQFQYSEIEAILEAIDNPE